MVCGPVPALGCRRRRAASRHFAAARLGAPRAELNSRQLAHPAGALGMGRAGGHGGVLARARVCGGVEGEEEGMKEVN